MEEGNVFFALPGERTDGHRFLEAAVEAGAGALVVSEELPTERLEALTRDGRVTVVRVPDTAVALRSVAARYRDRFEPLVVGITGSLAKTSTKEQVAEVLEEHYRTLRNPANWNNEIGLPLTLLRLRPEHEAAVLEMGFYDDRRDRAPRGHRPPRHRGGHGRTRRPSFARRIHRGHRGRQARAGRIPAGRWLGRAQRRR